MKPQNGAKTRPITAASLKALADISDQPRPRIMVNPGVCNRLARECLVETIKMRSPYKAHRGEMIAFLRITDAGKSALAKHKGHP